MPAKTLSLTLLVATLAGPVAQAGIFIADTSDARTALDAATTASVDLPQVSAAAGDMIAIVVATNKKGSVATLAASKAGGSGTVGSQTALITPGDPYPTTWGWYQSVVTPGTLDWRITATSGTVNIVAAVYVIRADSGSVGLIDSADASTDTTSSIVLNYTFGKTLTDGVLIEAVSARTDEITLPAGYTDTPNTWTNRKAVSFAAVTGSTAASTYGLANGDLGKQTTSALGLAFEELITTDLPPSFSSDPVVTGNAVVGVPYSGSLTAYASDPNGDSLTFTKTGGPGWLLIGSDGLLYGTPSLGNLGLNTFTVEVADQPGGNTAVASLQVTVVEGLSIPVAESFEFLPAFSTTHNEPGWTATEADAAQIRPVAYSYGSLPITGVAHTRVLDVDGPVTANFTTPLAHQEVLLDTMVQVMRRTNPNPPASDPAAQCAFYFNSDGYLVVRHAVYSGGFTAVNQQWTTLANAPVANDQWVRLKVLTDYSSDGRGDAYFTVELDGTTFTSPQAYTQFFPTDEVNHMGGALFLCANSGLGTGSDGLNGLLLSGLLRMDDLTVGTPASLTAACTPYDWIERHYPGSDWEAVAVLDLDGDGLTTDQEYRAGTDPNDAASVLRLGMEWLPGGDVSLSWPSSLEGALTPYSIERSTDLDGWTVIASGLLRDLDSTQQWMETPPEGSSLFYRLSY